MLPNKKFKSFSKSNLKKDLSVKFLSFESFCSNIYAFLSVTIEIFQRNVVEYNLLFPQSHIFSLLTACTNTFPISLYVSPQAREVWLANRKTIGWFIDGYVFIKKLIGKEKLMLRCQKCMKGCTATAAVDISTGEGEIRRDEHNHPRPNEDEIDFKEEGDEATPKPKKKTPSSKGETHPGWEENLLLVT